MSFTKDSATDQAKKDLAKRIKVDESQISVSKVSDEDFPNMSLGSPVDGEMAAQMISSGWKIILGAGGRNYEYRADKYQLRAHGIDGRNHVIKS